ncbi:hypothetical protein [Formosa sp. A9]|uniref:hypothetical protein n=1 Tax=Formosa sp. A9 TaxID=3442641 RepID=UPI003EBB3CE4
MKKVIVDYKKLTPEILTKLTEKFPDGYNDSDIITFDNCKNETIEAVEIKTPEAIYLVKVSSKLRYTMTNFDTVEDLNVNDSGHVIVDDHENTPNAIIDNTMVFNDEEE